MSKPSTVKLYEFLEELQGFSDDEIAEALPLPVPPAALRGSLGFVAATVPENPAELDAHLTRLGEFCLGLRSDGYAPPA